MTLQSDRIDFITRFRDQYPKRPREDCVKAAGELLRLARRYQSMAVEACNGPGEYIHRIRYPNAGELIDAWQSGLERRQDKCAGTIRTLCTLWDLPVTLGGDPRGYTVRVHFPDSRGNTWGGPGEGWGVPS